MTPKEFLNIIISEQSRYVVAQNIIEIVKENEPVMLKLFIEDLETLGKKWISDESDRLNKERWQEYDEEVVRVNNIYITYGMSQEDYERRLPTPPMPVVASLPQVILWALEELKKRMTEPTPDIVNYNATEVAGELPEWLSLLSDNLRTERAIKYFPRAIEGGFMIQSSRGYEWKFGGQIRLAYFLSIVYDKPRHPADLEKLFNGIRKIDASISQAEDYKKHKNELRADVVKWIAEIDKKIFYD